MITDPSSKTVTVTGLEIGYRNSAGESGFSRSGINFTAREGEIVALIGPNGIGKSTLLRTMAGFQRPWAGNVLYGDRRVEAFTPSELSRIISFVSTETVQVSNMRVAELVAYGRFPYTNWLGRMRESDHRKVMESLDKVGLTHFAHRAVTRLSDGERQRAMIARAIAQDTPVIILDEPTAFLDVNNKYEIFHLLTSLAHQTGKTIILTTHDLNIALRETDKLWIMLDEESCEGAPEDAALQGWLTRLFNSRNVGFDMEGGDFYFRKEHAGFARVTGEGLYRTWTERALERKGYSLTDDPTAPIKIDISLPESPDSDKEKGERRKEKGESGLQSFGPSEGESIKAKGESAFENLRQGESLKAKGECEKHKERINPLSSLSFDLAEESRSWRLTTPEGSSDYPTLYDLLCHL